MSSRTIFNELGDSRVINPRSGYSQFVDLSNNQVIFGEKRFLSNLTTNSNVNFNKTNNIGRVVVHPNTLAEGIINIYTVDATDGKRWEFSNNGDLAYVGASPNAYKLVLSPNGDIITQGDIDIAGTVTCIGLDTATGPIYVGTIFCGDISGGNIKAISVDCSNGTITGGIINARTSVKTNLISPYTGTDITFSSDTYFKNTSLLNRVSIVSSVTSGEILTIRTTAGGGGRWHFSTNSNMGYFNGTSHICYWEGSSGNLACGIISGSSLNVGLGSISSGAITASGTGVVSTTGIITVGTGGVISGTGIKSSGVIYATGAIASGGAISGISLDTGLGSISSGAITASGTGVVSTTGVITAGTGGVILGTGIKSSGVIYATGAIASGGAISGTSLNGGSGLISTNGNITGSILTGTTSVLTNLLNSYSGGIISCNNEFNMKSSGGTTNIILNPNGAIDKLIIYGITGGTKYFTFNTSNELGLYNTPTTSFLWKIDSLGAITSTSLSAGTGLISTTGNISGAIVTGTTSIKSNILTPYTGDTITLDSTLLFFKNATNQMIRLDSRTTTNGNRMEIYATPGLQENLYFSTGKRLGYYDSVNFVDIWRINGTDGSCLLGNILCYGDISGGIINASGGVKTNIINSYSGSGGIITCNSDFYIKTTAQQNRIEFYPNRVAGEIAIFRATANGSSYFHVSTNDNFGFWTGSAHTFYINGPSASITCQTISAQSNLSNAINIPSGGLTAQTMTSLSTSATSIYALNGGISGQTITASSSMSANTMTIYSSDSAALYIPNGGIHLANNNWTNGRIRFGDGNFAYIAEYDAVDTNKLYLFGSTGIYCNTLPVVPSDIRIKENIEDFIFDNPLEMIDKIRLVKYNRIDNPSKKRVLGYIAQEMLEIFPMAVEIDNIIVKKDDDSVLFEKNEDGTDKDIPVSEERLALNYSYVSMLNSEAIKQLNTKVEKQHDIINILIERIDKQQELIDKQLNILIERLYKLENIN